MAQSAHRRGLLGLRTLLRRRLFRRHILRLLHNLPLLHLLLHLPLERRAIRYRDSLLFGCFILEVLASFMLFNNN